MYEYNKPPTKPTTILAKPKSVNAVRYSHTLKIVIGILTSAPVIEKVVPDVADNAHNDVVPMPYEHAPLTTSSNTVRESNNLQGITFSSPDSHAKMHRNGKDMTLL